MPAPDGDISKAVERRKKIKKQISEDRDEVVEELCEKMNETCNEMDGIKEDIGQIKTDVADIKNQQTGLIDLLTEHVEHHPRLRSKPRVPQSWKEKVLESETAIIIAVLGIVGSVVGALIVVIFR